MTSSGDEVVIVRCLFQDLKLSAVVIKDAGSSAVGAFRQRSGTPSVLLRGIRGVVELIKSKDWTDWKICVPVTLGSYHYTTKIASKDISNEDRSEA